VIEITVNTLVEYLQAVEELRQDGRLLWYRGCGDASHELRPSLFRHKNPPEGGYEALERTLVQRFKQRWVPFQPRQLQGDWEYLFFMQHYGVPTRLLDWTENPFIGLFFAATLAPHIYDDLGQMAADCDAVVWVLDPVTWNRSSLANIKYDRGILSPAEDEAASYAPLAEWRTMRTEPVAVYGTYNSVRIAAQKGVFVLFGKEREPLEEIAKLAPYADCLARIVVPRGRVAPLLGELTRTGFSDSVVFPDLDGLARELKRELGFEVR
jgi:hypothetical protein